MNDAHVAAADGSTHLVPPDGKLTFCGREPTGPGFGDPCPDCVELAAARDHAQAKAARR
jgi:hypothetical protein